MKNIYIRDKLNKLHNGIISLGDALGEFEKNSGDVNCINIMHPLYNIIAYRESGEIAREILPKS